MRSSRKRNGFVNVQLEDDICIDDFIDSATDEAIKDEYNDRFGDSLHIKRSDKTVKEVLCDLLKVPYTISDDIIYQNIKELLKEKI
jgi:hypothetical protein